MQNTKVVFLWASTHTMAVEQFVKSNEIFRVKKYLKFAKNLQNGKSYSENQVHEKLEQDILGQS